MILAPEPLRRRLALPRGGDETVSLCVRVPFALEPDRFEAVMQDCIERFDAFRLEVVEAPGISSPLVSLGEPADIRFTWRPPAAGTEGLQDAMPPIEAHSRRNRVDIVVDRRPDESSIMVRVPARCADRRSLEILINRIVSTLTAANSVKLPDEVSYLAVAEWLQELSQSVAGSRGKLFWHRQMGDETLAGLRRALTSSPVEVRRQEPMPSKFRKMPPASRESVTALSWLRVARVMTGNRHAAIGFLADGRVEDGLREAVGPLSRLIPLAMRDDNAAVERAIQQVVESLAEGREWQELFALDHFAGGRAWLDYFPYCFEYVARPQANDLLFEAQWDETDDDRYLMFLRCEERDDELRVVLRSRDPEADAEALQVLIERWFGVLTRCLERPELPVNELAVLTSRERAALPWQGTAGDADGTVHEALSRACDRYGDRTAVSFRGVELTFSKLESLASALAALLPPTPPEAVIAVQAERSPELLIALFAILKAGAAFLPIDPRLPETRRRQLAQDSGATLILSDRTWQVEDGGYEVVDLAAACAAARSARPGRLNTRVHPDQLAYVLYTSGSSGKPQGAAISHRSVLNLWGGLNEAISELAEPRRVGMNGPISFDTSIKQLVQLLSGHTIVLIPEATRLDPADFWTHMAAEEIEVVDFTPSHLVRLLGQGARQRALPRVALLGGESPPEELWTGCAFERCYNLYGLTECAVDSIVGPIAPGLPVATLGKPLRNTGVALVDHRRTPLPDGVEGELIISGMGLARGYFGSASRTAERFIPNPFGDGNRAFTTTDVARKRGDVLQYVGRSSNVVKIRGRRVSLKGVQNEIEAMPGVAEAIVAKRPTGIDMAERIVAWVVPTAAGAPVVDGFVRYAYEDLFVAGLNRHETTFLCREVFERSAYLRHGLSLPEGACVFDVGANIGVFSLQAHLCSPGARIFAFEPNPDAYRCLLANVRIFGLSGEFLCVGLGSHKGQAEFTAYDGLSLLSGFHADREADLAVVREYLRHQQLQMGAGETELLEDLLKNRLEARWTKRPVTTISDVIRQHAIDAIDFLKINVEKSEDEVLEGVRREDWAKIRQVALEAHNVNGRLDDIIDLLERRGFSVTTEKDWSLPGAESINYYVYASRSGVSRLPAPAVRRSSAPPPLTSPDIKRALAARLPDYEVPERVLMIERMPLNDHGKVDQAALDELLAQPDMSGRPEPPRTQLEAQLLTEWQEILGRDDIGVETNFLDGGGDSFSIMRLNLRIRRLLGIDVSVVDMFRHSSVRQLANVLECQATERDVAGIV